MSDRKIRIAVLQFSHETVSFLPNETTRDDFICPLAGQGRGVAALRSHQLHGWLTQFYPYGNPGFSV